MTKRRLGFTLGIVLLVVGLLAGQAMVLADGGEIELIEGINIVHYTGASCDLPEAITNVEASVDIIWVRADWTGGEWLFYDFTFPPGSTLGELEEGRAYLLVVNEGCVWELPS
ncbi:MAG: hypothetical protein V3U97_04110 [bacterium]